MINYGIIGAGMMGREHIRNIGLLPGARVDAIYEPDSEMRARAGALVPDAAAAGSVADLLARPSLDCLLIASPNHLHIRQIEEIAAIRPLPLLVEKPLFISPDEAGRVEALARGYPAPIWVAMEYRYMPPIAMMLDRAQAETGGIRMFTIREHRFPFLDKVGAWNRFNASSGGTLVEKCCHFFDLMRVATGAEPVRVMASGGQPVNHLDEVYDGQRPDVWDNAYAIVDFRQRGAGHARTVHVRRGLEVPGAPDRHRTDRQDRGAGARPDPVLAGSPRPRAGAQGRSEPAQSRRRAGSRGAGRSGLARCRRPQRFDLLPAQPVLEVVRSGGPVNVTLSDGAKAVAMGLAAQRSAETGEAVLL